MSRIELIQTIILIAALLFAAGAYLKAYFAEIRMYKSNEKMAEWVRLINDRIKYTAASHTETD